MVPRSERAPSAEELFANGPHAGTQSFEVGDPDLDTEKSWGLEATLAPHGRRVQPSAPRFFTAGSTAIFTRRRPARSRTTCLFSNISRLTPAISASNSKASAKVARVGGFAINLDGVADYVRATIDGAGAGPAHPAAAPARRDRSAIRQAERPGRGRMGRRSGADRRLRNPDRRLYDGQRQHRFHPWGEDNRSAIILSANNLFDVDARRHASFLKDYAPLPGRDIRISARFAF